MESPRTNDDFPVRQCSNCGYIVSEADWQAFKYTQTIRCCSAKSMQRTTFLRPISPQRPERRWM